MRHWNGTVTWHYQSKRDERVGMQCLFNSLNSHAAHSSPCLPGMSTAVEAMRPSRRIAFTLGFILFVDFSKSESVP